MAGAATIRLVFFEQSIGCDTCAPARRALQQLAQDTPGVELEVLNLVLDRDRAAEYGVDRVPALVVEGQEDGPGRIRYYGAPLGNELTVLIDAIAMLQAGETRLSAQSRAHLSALSSPVQVRVFFTPTCVFCPQMVALAAQAAIESPHVSMLAVDATEFPDLVRRDRVNGVPKTIINETVEIVGAASEEEFIAALA